MNAREEVEHGRREWETAQRQERYAGFWDLTSEDITAWERQHENKYEINYFDHHCPVNQRPGGCKHKGIRDGVHRGELQGGAVGQKTPYMRLWEGIKRLCALVRPAKNNEEGMEHEVRATHTRNELNHRSHGHSDL